MKQCPIAIGLLVALLTSPSSFAANPNSAELMLQSQQRLSSMRESLGLDENHSFQFQSLYQDQLGQTHVRFQQLYRGIRIWGGEVITHTLANQKELPRSNRIFKSALNQSFPMSMCWPLSKRILLPALTSPPNRCSRRVA